MGRRNKRKRGGGGRGMKKREPLIVSEIFQVSQHHALSIHTYVTRKCYIIG